MPSIAILVGLGACEAGVRETADDNLLGPPDGVTIAEDGATMSFVGVSNGGCEMFQPVAREGEAAVQAIHFRTRQGGFSINKDDAHCVVEMEPGGIDDDGCETFRPIWPNGESVDQAYYRAGNSYVTFKAKSACGT